MSYTDFKNVQVDLVMTGVGATFGALASAGVGTIAGLGSKGWKAYAAMNLGSGGPNPGSVTCLVAPSSSIQPATIAIMDGTSTLATSVVTTFTAGQAALLTKVSGAINVAQNDTLTVNVYGTATVSLAAGQASGQWDVFLALNPAFE